MSDLVGNPEDRLSHNEAHIIPFTSRVHLYTAVTSSLLFAYSENGGNLGLVIKCVKGGYSMIKSHVV